MHCDHGRCFARLLPSPFAFLSCLPTLSPSLPSQPLPASQAVKFSVHHGCMGAGPTPGEQQAGVAGEGWTAMPTAE